LEGGSAISIENMNCRSFSESLLWKDRIENILNKYRGNNEPKAIILLGQEAWASYLSQDNINYSIPVFAAMASRNAVILPDKNSSSEDLESIDFVSDLPTLQMQGGFLYNYAVEENVQLIMTMYPETQNIAFVSDNTYGGVSLQAFVKKEMKKFPDLNLILLDGRHNTIYTIIEALRSLPPNTALLLGTWRVDEQDGYFMQNATFSMMEAVPSVPAFSLTSLGIGHWAIGGYIPGYRNFGKELALQVINVMTENNSANQPVIVSNRLVIDSKIIKELGIDRSVFGKDAEFINVETSFYNQYRNYIWGGIFTIVSLSATLLITLVYFARTRRLKNSLVLSEAELRTAKEKAEESNLLKSAFLANMSHEIRTPLNAIVGFSDILTTKNVSPEKQKSYFEIIRNSSDLLLRLINDVLDISRLETEKIKLNFQKCEIVSLIYRVIATVKHSTKAGNQFTFHPSCDSFEMCTDEQRLQQVLINLLSNSSKFTNNGIIATDFSIDEDNGFVLFSVTDTGCGKKKKKRDVVFDRFSKLNSFAQGTGLGLSICKLITSKWGGDIWIDPEYSNGTRFVFSHPLNINQEINSKDHEKIG
jgi:signal transduction histidine kinase